MYIIQFLVAEDLLTHLPICWSSHLLMPLQEKVWIITSILLFGENKKINSCWSSCTPTRQMAGCNIVEALIKHLFR